MLDFITNEKHLDLPFLQEFLDTDPGLQDLWLFLSWFLQFISPVALFPVECGHKAMVMMKFFSGCRVEDQAPHPLNKSKYFNQKLRTKISEKGAAATEFLFIYLKTTEKKSSFPKRQANVY